MKFIISGSEVEIGAVTFSEIDFGRHLDGQEEEFTLIVSSHDFTNRFRPIYAECVTELIRDDEITGEFHAPYIGAALYPSFDEFLNMAEPQRMEMINTYFVFDILRQYISEDASDVSVQWNIGSLDSLQLKDGILTIGGRVTKKS